MTELAHFAQIPLQLFFYKTSGPRYRFQEIRDASFILFDGLTIFTITKKSGILHSALCPPALSSC